MKTRVLLADDHVLVREGIRKLLEPEFDVVGAVDDGRELLEAAARLKPDVVLLDLSMPLINGVEAARRLRRTLPGAKLLFVTMHGDPTYVTEALRVGASGYVLKSSAPSELVKAIREVIAGRCYITPLVNVPGGVRQPSKPAAGRTDGKRRRRPADGPGAAPARG